MTILTMCHGEIWSLGNWRPSHPNRMTIRVLNPWFIFFRRVFPSWSSCQRLLCCLNAPDTYPPRDMVGILLGRPQSQKTTPWCRLWLQNPAKDATSPGSTTLKESWVAKGQFCRDIASKNVLVRQVLIHCSSRLLGGVCPGGACPGCVCLPRRGCVFPVGASAGGGFCLGVSAQWGCVYTSPLWTDRHLWKQPFRNYCCGQQINSNFYRAILWYVIVIWSCTLEIGNLQL